MATNNYIENYVPAVRDSRGLITKLPVTLSGTAANLTVGGNLLVTGTTSFTSDVITAASANAFAVGRVGITNPTFNVDSSAATVATGLNIAGAAAAGGVALSRSEEHTSEL